MADPTWLAEIKARHEVSAPFQGDHVGSKASYNQAREDRGEILREFGHLRTALHDLVEALAVHDEDGLTEFAPQMQAARAALRNS